MPRVELTDRYVSSAKTGDYFDAKTPGLNLRVTPNGVRSWFIVFTAPKDGKRARATLGRYPQTSLARARAKAGEARSYLEEGQDPRDAFAAEAGTMTVRALIASFLSKYVRPNLRSAKAIERRFSKNVTPLIGNIRLADLHKREINRAIDPILERGKPIEATRCFQDLRAMFRWAVARGDLDSNPMEGMRMPAVSAPRERVLSDTEIAKLWNGLPTTMRGSPSCQRIIKLLLLTAQRVGEVSGIRLDELDLKTRTWIIPAARSKNKHAHTVPLSDAAVDVIEEALPEARCQILFPDDVGKGSLRADAVSKTITKARERVGIEHWTAHDLRRTVVTGMALLGVAPIVLGHVINHRSVTKAGVTLAVYAHYDYAKEKRHALDLWAERLTGIVDGASPKIMPLRGAR